MMKLRATFFTVAGGACFVMLPMASSFVTNTPITTTVQVTIDCHAMARHKKKVFYAKHPMHQRQQKALSVSALFVVPQNKKENDKDTSLFPAITPGSNEDGQPATSTPKNIIDADESTSPFDNMQTIGMQALVAVVALAIFSNIASFLVSLTTSTASAIGNELAIELAKAIHNIAWLLGSILKFFGGMALEGTKAAAPVVGNAVVSGAKQFGQVAGPVIQDAAQHIGDAAAPAIMDATQQISDMAFPYVQEAARQVAEVTSPYLDSVSNSVSESVVTPISSAVESVSSQAVDALSSTVDSVSNQAAEVVAPFRDAVDAVSSMVDETLVAPITAVGESIPFRAF